MVCLHHIASTQSMSIRYVVKLRLYMYVQRCTTLELFTTVSMHTARQKKARSVQWIDSRSRFLARVCQFQDCPPLLRMELRVPRVDDEREELIENNLYLELQETLILRPYVPNNAMLAVNKHLYEVTVFVDNFWSTAESGGNSGRVVRRGTVYVRGDNEDLRRLRGEKDTRFTARTGFGGKRGAARTNTDASGVRGLTHKLHGGVNIRRMRTTELESSNSFGSRWVCIDYTPTHTFHCIAQPRCVSRKGGQPPAMNPCCFNQADLYLVRQKDNEHDTNAISIVCQPSGRKEVVGFVPRELAACLAPAIDTFAVMLDAEGVYDDAPKKGCKRNRVWFRIDGHTAGGGGPDSHLVNDKLQAIPWWVKTTEPQVEV